jgi:hypothetical protein
LAVLVDESVAGGVSSDRSAGPIRDNFGSVRCALMKAAVRAVRVVMLDVFVQESFELAVVPDHGPVAELAPDGAAPPFGVGVRDWRVQRGADDGRALAAEHVIEAGEELAGAVADQESDCRFGTYAEVAGGLGGSRAGRVGGDAGEVYAATVEFDEEQFGDGGGSAGPVRVGPVLRDEPSMPPYDRVGLHREERPPFTTEHTRERSEDGAVVGREPGVRVLASKHGELGRSTRISTSLDRSRRPRSTKRSITRRTRR